ncbi:MAG: formylglycine-generating enzyme family protein [Rhodospirillaceae bacterium]|jgi:formylglycine-generating enzyme required for sulfatase activity|nr:formylglycine-generating enzyme family protein [Rhodospirillaceae bacterium]
MAVNFLARMGMALAIPLSVSACALTPDASFKDCSSCPEMVVIPEGTFVMGANPDASTTFKPVPNELPQRRVTIETFAIGKYEVTQAQWFDVMGERPSEFTGDELPVETVSWNDIQNFIRKLNTKTDERYRLPTEAEWEYAARAGSSGQFFFGDNVAALDMYAWYLDNSDDTTHPVGQKRPNMFGLYDVHGNVWEWTADCYKDSFEGAPTDGRAVEQAGHCYRVDRGGSWINKPFNLRSTQRHRSGAGDRYFGMGVRLARTLD